MSAGQYIIVSTDDAGQRETLAVSAAAALGNNAVRTCFGRTVVLTDGLPVRSSDCGRRLFIGHRFPRLADAAPESFGTTGPIAFWDAWGSFLELSSDVSGTMIARDPSGMLPCYVARSGDSTVFASDATLLSHLIPQHISWSHIAAFLATDGMRCRATCLANVEELLPGTCERLDDGMRTTLWSPWMFVRPSRPMHSDLAADALRAVVDQVTAAWAARFPRILLGVSGGLDSSIVAAALAQTDCRPTLITLATQEPDGDERAYARTLADFLDLPLIEDFESPGHVDLLVSAAAHLPRPVARAFSQSSDANQLAQAKALGVDAFMNGGGGDSVFCALRSASPLADRLLAEPWPGNLFRTMRDICQVTGSPIAPVFIRGVRNALRGPRPSEGPRNPFLTPDCLSAAGALPLHPWLTPPPCTPPGKAAHAAWILGILNHLDPVGRAMVLPSISPLMAQPVVELCLAIPTWMWVSGGRDRAVARRAFADRLPSAILERRSKGTPASFVMHLFESRRTEIGEMLCDGLLAGNGLVDRNAVHAYLSDPRPVSDARYMQIMGLVDAESWARSWTR